MAAQKSIVVVGGGAAGFFAAITAAETLRAGAAEGRDGGGTVTLYEATAHLVAKVRISGGGRCNVTHACFEPRELVKKYPRGGRELIGAFSRFQPRDTVAWFASRGVELKTESDGRMFPVTDDSATIVACLQRAAADAGVRVVTGVGVRSLKVEPVVPNRLAGDAESPMGAAGPTFRVELTTGESISADRVLIATGGNKSSAGLAVARALGHEIEPAVPSLFTFNIAKDARLEGLAGVAVERVETSVRGMKLKERGPLLVTHWGVSGPGILKLSAWGARDLAAMDYKFTLVVNFAPEHSRETLVKELAAAREKNLKKQVTTWSPVAGMPQRFWERLVVAAGIGATTPWTNVGNAGIAALAAQVGAAEFAVSGKSTNKDEFVTCGGVRLREVEFRTMESRLCPGLHFAGEVLDIDGVTGGFNFQAAWTTGWLAGRAMAGADGA
ncbi:MAG: aminoacetone oxidase family FAD-binding enzyme [Verrucomicrobia bacterium]|nr:aminoacetone oxidase family FAD-binding enzyme [Verrucomicrobiota bacterium]